MNEKIEQLADEGFANEPVKAAQPAATEMKLSEEQQGVVNAIANGNNILITGSAGTGKSHLLKSIKEKFRLPVTASTGIAAINVGGTTIHSWSGCGIMDKPVKEVVNKIMQYSMYRTPDGTPNTYERITRAKMLAIDEISMLGAHQLNYIDEVFRAVRGNSNPFGGIQMVFFGDFLQLPPVIKGEEYRKAGTFAFESNAWKNAGVQTAMLTKVFRQADLEFSSALNQIRFGELSPEARKLLQSRFQVTDENPEIGPVVIHTHNRDVDAINESKLANLPGETFTYEAQDLGTNPAALQLLQKDCIAPAKLNLKIGAQVMLLSNIDLKIGLANGSMGIVVSVCSVTGLPTVKFLNGQECQISHKTWEITIDGKVQAQRTALPLRCAWAITSHKSQGMSLDKVQAHLHGVFDYGQSYVILSRARTAGGLFIADGGSSSIKAHPLAVAFYKDGEKVKLTAA